MNVNLIIKNPIHNHSLKINQMSFTLYLTNIMICNKNFLLSFFKHLNLDLFVFVSVLLTSSYILLSLFVVPRVCKTPQGL